MTQPAPPLKHAAIAETLAHEIRSGTVAHGHQLPGEKALAERFSVSRGTVRQALAELSRAGLIATRSGRGSFVSFDGALLDSHRGWAVALADRGVSSDVEVLRLEPIVDAALAARLGLDASEFIAVDRVRRLSDGAAISYERSRVPVVGVLCDVPETGLIDGSLTTTLREAGLVAQGGDQWIAARPLTALEAAVLGRSEADVFLQSTRLSRSARGEFVEYVESALDPAHFQLHLHFS